MHYKIHYSCLSHIGNIRSINQDNFICDRRYMENEETAIEFPLCGTKKSNENSVFGIFDGMEVKNVVKLHHILHLKLPQILKLERMP